MKRRSFLNRSLLSGVGAAVSTPLLGSTKSLSSFNLNAVEFYSALSGNFKDDELVGVGVLQVNDSALAKEAILHLRQLHNYQSKLKYSSNDKYKLEFAKSVIDEFTTGSSMKLYIKIILGARAQFSDTSPLVRQQKKVEIFQELLSGRQGLVEINATSETPYGPSTDFKEAFQNMTSVQYKAQNQRKSDFLQIADFLLGNVLADMRGFEIRSKTKSQLLDYLKIKLGISGFRLGMDTEKIKII